MFCACCIAWKEDSVSTMNMIDVVRLRHTVYLVETSLNEH